jgi:Resolvase, N terminal domain
MTPSEAQVRATGVLLHNGRRSSALERRPQLTSALAEARKQRGAVVVAKLDRLSRDVHFISGLMVHRVPFWLPNSDLMLIPSCCICTRRLRRRNAP